MTTAKRDRRFKEKKHKKSKAVRQERLAAAALVCLRNTPLRVHVDPDVLPHVGGEWARGVCLARVGGVQDAVVQVVNGDVKIARLHCGRNVPQRCLGRDVAVVGGDVCRHGGHKLGAKPVHPCG